MSLTLPGYMHMWWHHRQMRRWEHKRRFHARMSIAAEVVRNEHEQSYSRLVHEARKDDAVERRAERKEPS